MIQAAKNYHAEMAGKGNVGTEFVKLPETFIGPNDHWREYVGELGAPRGLPALAASATRSSHPGATSLRITSSGIRR